MTKLPTSLHVLVVVVVVAVAVVAVVDEVDTAMLLLLRHQRCELSFHLFTPV